MGELKELIDREIEAIQNIPLDGGIENAVELIYQNVHQQSGKVVVSGVGKAGHIGLQLSTMLCSTGTSACFLNPLEAQHGDLGVLQNNDVLFAISNSGLTREILELVELSEKLCPEVKLIVLTRNPDSALAQMSNVVLLTGETTEICPFGLTPTTSTTTMNVITDLLVVTLMKKINFTKEMYAQRHHSGYLGAKSKQ